MKKSLFTMTLLALATLSLGQLHAANIALSGTAFEGYIQYDHFNINNPGTLKENPVGSSFKLNDDDTSTETNTFAGGDGPSSYMFEGIKFATPVSQSIDTLNLYAHRWVDGGWFSTYGHTGYVDGDPLSASNGDITAPTVQISFDIGTAGLTAATWTTVTGVSSNYFSALDGMTTGETRLTTFTFSTPLTGFEGIRLIGSGGGSVSFISATEIQLITVPEPSTYALLGLGALVLVVLRRRSLKA